MIRDEIIVGVTLETTEFYTEYHLRCTRTVLHDAIISMPDLRRLCERDVDGLDALGLEHEQGSPRHVLPFKANNVAVALKLIQPSGPSCPCLTIQAEGAKLIVCSILQLSVFVMNLEYFYRTAFSQEISTF